MSKYSTYQPPKSANRFLLWFLKDELLEEVEGDLFEHYQVLREEMSSRKAFWVYWFHVLHFLRPFALKKFGQNSNHIFMFNTYFKFASRSIWKERGYSLMNVLGLTTGIAASMLLFLYVQSEKSVNTFHKDLDQVHQVMMNQTFPGGIITYEDNPGPLVTAFADEMPEVEYMAAFTWTEERLFIVDEQGYKASGRWASEDFFHVFGLDFIEGDIENSSSSPTEIFISKGLKERIFGREDALYQNIEMDGWGQFQIAGVFEDVPKGSTIDFEFILPYARWAEINTWVEDWGNSGISGIAKLVPGTNLKAFNEKIKGYVDSKLPPGESNSTIFLQPIKERYLYGKFENGQVVGGRITYVKVFTLVAISILVIAAINFMNLATARSSKRAKEVGVKKVVGSTRIQLQSQFMMESILLALLSTVIAGFLIMLVLNPLNTLVGKEMTFSWLQLNDSIWLLFLGLSVGLLAGIYPSFVLSEFKALTVLKGTFKNASWSKNLRKGLVVFQFMVSTLLIISTLIIRTQMDFIKNKNLGYDKEHLILMQVEGALWDPLKKEQFMTSLLANPNFTDITFSSGSPLDIGSSTTDGFSWEGKTGDYDNLFNIIRTDPDFIDTYGMEIIEGRNFNVDLHTDTMNIIINEQTAKVMNVDDPFSVPVTFWGRAGRVVGIVKDFHFTSLHNAIDPLILAWRPNNADRITIRVSGQNVPSSLTYLEGLLADINPHYPANYNFVDASYQQLYQSESTISILMDYFSGIAIFISLLGLFGLSSYAAEERIKEIGIRKVLGASAFNLIFKMSKGFLFLMLLGFILAVPIGYSFMNNWLESFEYKIQIGASVFVFAALISLLITITTVSYHAVRTACANPVKSLRYE
jgi:ABC-type antimicrobial peptide transport system permease subunit